MKYIFICFVLILASSCKQNDNLVTGTDVQTKNGKNSKTQSGFAFDSIGIYHNMVLDEFISNVSNFDNKCDSADVVNTFFDELSSATCTVGYQVPSSDCNTLSRVSIVDAYTQLSDTIDLTSSFEQTNAYNKAIALLTVMNNYSQSNPDSLLTYIQNWTEGIYNSSLTYSANDKDKLLKSGSIAYYSTQYWYNVSINPNSPWHFVSNCTAGKRANTILIPLKDYLAVGAADVIGFYAANWLGAITGSAATSIWVFWDDGIGDWFEGAGDTISDWWGSIF